MTIRQPFAAVAALLTFVASAIAAPTSTAADKPASAGATNAVTVAPPKPTLQPGMTAEAITELLGKPVDVRPMPSPEGKAEVWTYRRVAERRTRPVAALVESTPAFVGVGLGNDGIGAVSSPGYRLQRTTVYQMTWVLMLNGKMVTAKQGRQQESAFE